MANSVFDNIYCNSVFFAILLYLLSSTSFAKDSPTAIDDKTFSASEPLHIRYPDFKIQNESYLKQIAYFLELLELSLKKQNINYTLEGVITPTMTSSRSSVFLQQDLYDIVWLNTNAQHEKVHTPIRIPLLKGLIGWRMLLIRKEDLSTYASIVSLDELKTLTAGQGHDWPDTEILKHNDFKILTSHHTKNLIEMLTHERIDYYPRSITEIIEEAKYYKNDVISIEKTIVVKYPAAYYFFVKHNNNALADIIETGLEIAIKDGSFDKTLMKYYGENIEQMLLKQRKIFSIKTPSTNSLPVDKKELWFSLENNGF